MSIINGRDFIERLNKMKNEIWFDGEKIKGKISEHPAFKGILKSKASLYDLQNTHDLKEEMTFFSPEKEDPIGLSYLQPKTKEDLKRRRKMIEHWARHTHGMMGRSPDYMNTVVMSFASSCFPFKRIEKIVFLKIFNPYMKGLWNKTSRLHIHLLLPK